MNVSLAVKLYINKMIEECGAGMKVLVMDKATTAIVSMVYSQSEIIQKEVYLCELLSTKARETMKHLSAICFLRPTHENVELLCDELRHPKYNTYSLYFSNVLSKSSIKQLAEADDHEVVKDIKEFYGDFIAISQHVFSFNLSPALNPSGTWRGEIFDRVSVGVLSVLLALKKNPLIRYSAGSKPARYLADTITRGISKEGELFSFRRTDVPPLLLILDRRDDPITPLLNQWTYQAMVHELLGIKNNRVDLSKAPGISRELHEVVMSSEQDDFYRENMYLNFGEIGANIKVLAEEFQVKQKDNKKIESIADMKAFVENYPEFKKLSGTVMKHVAVISELSRIVADQDVMKVSELEQDIVTQSDRSTHFKNVQGLILTPNISKIDRLRLVMLFALRYEKQGKDIEELVRLLKTRDVSESEAKCVTALLEYVNQSNRLVPLFDSAPVAFTKKFFKGLKGVENVFTRHTPQLVSLLDAVVKGKLKESQYPYLGDAQLRDRPQDIIVFVVGGVTYEEAFAVANFNKTTQGVRVVLGGTTVHNCHMFVDEVLQASYSGSRAAGIQD